MLSDERLKRKDIVRDDPANLRADPEVHADGRAAAGGQASGPATSGADMARPEANPFDLASIRLSQDFASAVGVKKIITTIPVRKPTTKGAFIRTHPNPEHWFKTKLLEMDDGVDRESYLVARGLWDALDGEPLFAPFQLVTCISRPGNVLFVMKIRLPGPDGRTSEWTRSAMEAAEMARTIWVRIVPRMELGGYQPEPATRTLPDPVWPEITPQETLDVAFRDKKIADWNHPVLKRLRGEA
jgi:hypothetical protein